MWSRPTPPAALGARRVRLAKLLGDLPALVVAGLPRAKNYAASTFPFRAESHFLYLVGRHLAGAALLVDARGATLFVRPPEPGDALWHGPSPGPDALAAELGLEVRPVGELAARLDRARTATLPPAEEATAAWQSELLGRAVRARSGHALEDGSPDARLADAMIALRLAHDDAAEDQLRQAAEATALAHAAGMHATRAGLREAHVRAAMEAALLGAGMGTAYGSIVTVHGEVLHHEACGNELHDGALLLCDVGAETAEGWAGDVTRTWPVSGRFSPTQRAMYELVLEAQRRAIEAATPGRRWRDVHLVAGRAIVEGLVHLGVYRGDVDGLMERGAHAVFFPHGVGHLLGLDVHDMEDLGDRAGYAPGRARAARFGDRYLRLDRDLAPGMAVTVEPGFYQVPAILADASLVGPVEKDLDRAALARFADVRGIRIEDDVLVTAAGNEVLTRAIPKQADEVERAVRG